MSAPSQRLRVAIVGAGPAGQYAAVDLLQRCPQAEVELFDRTPTMGGLVRYGVSPDHAARRKVGEVCERLAMSSGRFRFHGNVELGKTLSHDQLAAHHHAVIYASGAASDRALGIPGEALAGSHAATDFVGWYNGHPDFADRQFDLDCERAVVVGNGNVALDVARMLLLPPDHLARSDMADHAIDALRRSRVREVVILGRRGPAQAAFTAPELLELGQLPGVDVTVEGIPTDATAPGSLRERLIHELASLPNRGKERRLVLRFLCSPQEALGTSRLERLRIAHNRLVADADGVLRAQADGHTSTLDCGLLFRSIGYRALPLSGLPFDDARGVLPNRAGRVLLEQDAEQALPGVYVTGWLKRGPSGVIGSNKQCARGTVDSLLEDWQQQRLPVPAQDREGLDALLREHAPASIDYLGWKRIDRTERQHGADARRPRVKLTTRDALQAAAAP